MNDFANKDDVFGVAKLAESLSYLRVEFQALCICCLPVGISLLLVTSTTWLLMMIIDEYLCTVKIQWYSISASGCVELWSWISPHCLTYWALYMCLQCFMVGPDWFVTFMLSINCLEFSEIASIVAPIATHLMSIQKNLWVSSRVILKYMKNTQFLMPILCADWPLPASKSVKRKYKDHFHSHMFFVYSKTNLRIPGNSKTNDSPDTKVHCKVQA